MNHQRLGTWVLPCLALVACRRSRVPADAGAPACVDGACEDAEVKVDAATTDDVPEEPTLARDASPDVGDVLPPPPWADGTWRLPDVPRDAGTPERCDPLTPVATRWPADNGPTICRFGDSLFIDAQSNTYRLHEPTGQLFDTLGIARLEAGGQIRCAPSALFAGVTDRGWNTAILRFERADGDGRVIWTGNEGRPLNPLSSGGFYYLAVTERLVSWIFLGGPRSPALFVSGPRGEDPYEVPVAGLPYDLRADGDRVVFVSGNDLWMFTASTRALENLTPDQHAQWNPWISGDHLVWMDQRDNPGHDHWNPDNPEVYYMNLRDRVPVRITHDPPERPAYQYGPVTDGRWIVWADFRNNATPNVALLDNESNIYGYRLDTRREEVLVDGRHRLYFPTILDGELYVACGAPRPATGPRPTVGLHRMALPR